MENYLLSSLMPFISENEISYYAQLTEEVLIQLVSLAPFVNNSENLYKLSKMDISDLEKIFELLPVMNPDDIKEFFNTLE